MKIAKSYKNGFVFKLKIGIISHMHKFLSTRSDIEAWLLKCDIDHYTLIPDEKYGYVVDVAGCVNIPIPLSLTHIPVKFNSVEGNFTVALHALESLEGSPHTVGGNFDCFSNQLRSLKGGPSIVGGAFNCAHNPLVSLRYGPHKVGKNYIASKTFIKNLIGSPKQIKGYFFANQCKLTTLKGAPKTVKDKFEVYDNVLTILEHCPRVGGDIDVSRNQLVSIEGLPETGGTSINLRNNFALGETKYKTLQELQVEIKAEKEKLLLEKSIAKTMEATAFQFKI